MVVTGYFALVDLGITSAVVKYVAEYKGIHENKTVNEIISTSFFILTILGVIVAIGLIIISNYFDLLFKIGETNKYVVKELFWIAAIAALFIWPGKSLEAALQGFQGYGWLAINNIFSTICIGITAFIIFSKGFPITYYLASYYLFIIIKYISAYFIIYYRFLPENIKLFYYSKSLVKKLFGFGSYIFLGSIMNIIILQFDNILIGAYISVAAVSIYAVVYNLQNMIRGINSLIGGPLFPICAEMEGQRSYDRQKLLLFKGTKYTTFLFVSMVIITIMFTGPIVNNWMGNQFAESILPAQILLTFYIFNGTIDIGMGIITAKGFVKIPFFINMVNAIVNISISLLLVRYLGIVGVVLGTTIPMVLLNFPLLLYFILKLNGASVKEFYIKSIKTNLLVYGNCVILSVIMQKTINPDRLWLVVLEMAIVYGAALMTGYWWFLTKNEKEEIKSILKTCLGGSGKLNGNTSQ